MAKKPKKGEKGYQAPKKPFPAVLPINRAGEVRLGTLGVLVGTGMAIGAPAKGQSVSPYRSAREGKWGDAGNRLIENLNPRRNTPAKLILLGLAIALVGKGRKVTFLRAS